MKKINAGLIGTGFGESHLQLLSQIESINISWLGFQTNKSKTEEVALKYNIPNVTPDYRKVNTSDVDFVIVSTPVYTHFDIIRDAIESGKHVVSDKPLAMDQYQCEELVRLASQKRIKNMTFFQWRFNNTLLTLREIINNKEIGELYSITTNFYTDFMADESIPYLWRHDKSRAGMGVIADMGIHLVDLIYWLTKGEIIIENAIGKSVYPYRKSDANEIMQVSTEDFSNLQYRLLLPYQNAAVIGSLTTCRTAHGLKKLEIVILGTKGSLYVEINPFTRQGKILMNNKSVCQRYQSNENPYFHWVNALNGNEAAVPDFEDGLKSQRIIDTIDKKLKLFGRSTL